MDEVVAFVEAQKRYGCHRHNDDSSDELFVGLLDVLDDLADGLQRQKQGKKNDSRFDDPTIGKAPVVAGAFVLHEALEREIEAVVGYDSSEGNDEQQCIEHINSGFGRRCKALIKNIDTHMLVVLERVAGAEQKSKVEKVPL